MRRALRPGLRRFRQIIEGQGMEVFAYMDDVSLGRIGIKTNTIRALVFFRRELDGIAIAVNPAKTVAPPP